MLCIVQPPLSVESVEVERKGDVSSFVYATEFLREVVALIYCTLKNSRSRIDGDVEEGFQVKTYHYFLYHQKSQSLSLSNMSSLTLAIEFEDLPIEIGFSVDCSASVASVQEPSEPLVTDPAQILHLTSEFDSDYLIQLC